MRKRPLWDLQGTTDVRVTGAEPWRFLRRCAEEGILLTDASAKDAFTCRARLLTRDVPRARRAADRCGCVLETAGEAGIPRLGKKLRRRAALCAGIGAVFALLAAASLFVWDIRVTENDSRVPDAVILRVLSEQGVGVGSFWPAFRGERIRTRALTELPELSWLAVNVRGGRAMVEVRAFVPPPEIFDPGRSADIRAVRSGVIESIHVLSGRAEAARGDAVTAGQTLISGTEVSPHARGEVRAYTYYELSASAPLTGTEKTYTGRETRRYALVFGQRRINFYADSGILPANCDKITKIWELSAENAFALPLRLVRETRLPYDLRTVAEDPAALRGVLEERLRAQLAGAVSDRGEIREVHFTSSENGETLTVTLIAECLERIGADAPRGE